jgi:hypothetical protein
MPTSMQPTPTSILNRDVSRLCAGFSPLDSFNWHLSVECPSLLTESLRAMAESNSTSNLGIRQNLPWSEGYHSRQEVPVSRGVGRGCMQGTRPCGVTTWHAILPSKTAIAFSRLSKEVGRVYIVLCMYMCRDRLAGLKTVGRESKISALRRGGNKPQGYKT